MSFQRRQGNITTVSKMQQILLQPAIWLQNTSKDAPMHRAMMYGRKNIKDMHGQGLNGQIHVTFISLILTKGKVIHLYITANMQEWSK